MDALERIKADLRDLGEITSRSMFGGHASYWNGMRFSIFFRGRLYFKVDDESKGEYLARGMGPFRPNERQTSKSYYEAPPEILHDGEALVAWAREAIRAGQESEEPAR
jgi:DNA transformation protein